MGLSFNDVNRRNSYTWTKCNDDAQSSYFRNKFIQKYGGEFTRVDREWEWTPSKEQFITLEPNISKPTKPIKTEPSKTWIFLNSAGKQIKTKNIQEFCKENKLTRSSLYEVITGKRKSHKGYSFVEIIIE